MEASVIIYTTNDCIECTMVKQVLTQEGIPFEIRDISVNPEYQREVEKYGFLGVPVTVVGDMAVKGFNNELQKVLEKLKEDK
ncbi:glutaredoxin family protein [Bacillus sp. CGMCC 1.16607]|uniref:glutaredoxin family protein n=1 Tax=Bacillus sp. CGMCC 1.16607 TaxID=3351842 RepID=UPI0036419944